MLKGLILKYPTCLFRPSWAIKTVVPLPNDNHVVILHALIRFKEARYQSDNLGLGLEIVSRVSELVALVHVNHIMPHEPQAHLLIESIYAAQDPK